MAQIPDKTLKLTPSGNDLFLIRDMTSNTDKRTTLTGVAAGVASNFSENAITVDKLDVLTVDVIALRQNNATIDQGTPSTNNTISNAVPSIKANLIANFVYRITYRTGSFDMGGTSNAELFTRLDSNTGTVLSVDAATTPKSGQYGSLAAESYYTATVSGSKTFVFCLQLSGTGVTKSSYTSATIECIGKPGSGL